VEQFSESGRTKFFKRLCGSSSLFKRFQTYQPQCALQEQYEELLAIQQLAAASQGENVPYDVALIGTHDKVIPTKNQQNFWRGRIPYTLIDTPHFPFFLWNSWKEVIDYATKHR
jgi:biotin synthesis protein BioG